MGWAPKQGFDWNPLQKMVQRNDPCICGSGKKWKKCCMDRITEIIPEPIARRMREAPNLEAAIEIHDRGMDEWNRVMEEKEAQRAGKSQESQPAEADGS